MHQYIYSLLNDSCPNDIYTLSLHDALPISNANIAEVVQKLKANSSRWMGEHSLACEWQKGYATLTVSPSLVGSVRAYVLRSEEHTSELQSRRDLVCRLLLEKKNK